MRPSLYEVYVLLVSLASLGGTIVSLFGGLYASIGVVHPDSVIRDHDWTYHQTNDRYWERTRPRIQTDVGWVEQATRPSEDELNRRRMESFEVERGSVRRDSWVALVMYGVGFAISLALFGVHWRLARPFRRNREQPAPTA
jgi:hypothetical protein